MTFMNCYDEESNLVGQFLTSYETQHDDAESFLNDDKWQNVVAIYDNDNTKLLAGSPLFLN